MTEDWLDFIVECRSGKAHSYDIVEGPIADDVIYNYIQDYLDEKISREAFWALAKFKHPTHQICFNTERSLKTLSFRGLRDFMNKNDDALFYTCSLIEYISRKTKNHPKDIITYLDNDLKRIYDYADVFHCEAIEKVACEFIERSNIACGNFDYISRCKYLVPSYWDIGKVFERLIEDCFEDEDVIEAIHIVYNSWLASKIYNFNSDLYYQPRDYLRECYRNGKILE